MTTVLMVAEKPSLAESLAKILSNGRSRSRKGVSQACAVHEFRGKFLTDNDALFKFTSVCGHLTSVDFPAKYNNWDNTDPLELFDAEVLNKEANPNLRLMKHLESEAKTSTHIVLWLDCDKEGENICFEILDAISRVFRISFNRPQTVFRAKFSSITEHEIRDAMRKLILPNKLESLSVDARKELDLRVGCAFTRFQTKFFHEKYGDLDSSLISFGPCQTPTLAFCVERHDAIQTFVPVPYWVLVPTVQMKESSAPFVLSWDKDREFNHQLATSMYNRIKGCTKGRVLLVEKKEKRKPPPPALNTVELLRVASSSLGIGPHQAMQVAERLYTQGYLSYPRTETTKYSDSFPFNETLQAMSKCHEWGSDASALMTSGHSRPRGGKDCGDHPPIHPLRPASRQDFDRDSWSIFEYVCRHFMATISPDFVYEQTTIKVLIGDEKFSKKGSLPVTMGYVTFMPWAAPAEDRVPSGIKEGDEVLVVDMKIVEKKTSPPDYLSESDLISLMEKHGIGTDASIPTHINNICQRNYVQVSSGRRLIPTKLGIVLVHGYQKIDKSLILPTSRSAMEKDLNQIALGNKDYKVVLKSALEEFREKFLFFRNNIPAMDELFQVSFSSLADSGKPLCKCGQCRRFMKLITSKPVRLYCPTCNETLSVPGSGSLRTHKEMTCPNDNFDLLYCNGGVNGKSFVLCPYCYNNAPFDGMPKFSGCNNCTNSLCELSMPKNTIGRCRNCRLNGKLIPDPGSAPPKFRIRCNQCLFMLEGKEDATRLEVVSETCNVCDSKFIELTRKSDGGLIRGCVFCSAEVSKIFVERIGARFAKMTLSDKSKEPTNGPPAAKPATKSMNAEAKAVKYDPSKDPNADEDARTSRRGGRGGRSSRGNRGGRSRGGRRGRNRGGRGGYSGGDDYGLSGCSVRSAGVTLSDFL